MSRCGRNVTPGARKGISRRRTSGPEQGPEQNPGSPACLGYLSTKWVCCLQGQNYEAEDSDKLWRTDCLWEHPSQPQQRGSRAQQASQGPGLPPRKNASFHSQVWGQRVSHGGVHRGDSFLPSVRFVPPFFGEGELRWSNPPSGETSGTIGRVDN